MEYKSWSEGFTKGYLKGKQSTEQLKNYLKEGNFEYVFNKQKLLKEVTDPDKFVKGEFQKVFRDNAKELFESNPKLFKEMNISSKNYIDSWEKLKDVASDNEMFNKLIGNKYIRIE